MDRTWRGARVLITGASSGIGAETVNAAARRGARLAISARRKDALESVAHSCSAADIAILPADIADLDAASALADSALETLGGIDIVVNAAGAPCRTHVTRLDPTTVEESMRVNYLGPVALTLGLLPAMLDQRRGDIVNVGSVAGRIPPPREAAYSAAKHALVAFSESAAADLADTGVKVHMVTPGVIDTPLWDRNDQEASAYRGAKLPASAVADAIIALVESGRFEAYVPGRFRLVNAIRPLLGGRFITSSARYDRKRVPEAYE